MTELNHEIVKNDIDWGTSIYRYLEKRPGIIVLYQRHEPIASPPFELSPQEFKADYDDTSSFVRSVRDIHCQEVAS